MTPAAPKLGPLRSSIHAASGLVERSDAATDAVIGALARRAERAGVDDVLVAHGRRLITRTSLIETVAYFRLLDQVMAGRVGQVSPLMHKFRPNQVSPTEFAAILRLLGVPVDSIDFQGRRRELTSLAADVIESEIRATGASSIFQWIAVHGAYELGDRELNRYVKYRLERALLQRHSLEMHECSAELTQQRTALIDAVNRWGDDAIFVAGATLLAHETGQHPFDPDTLQFGTFRRLDEVVDGLADSPIALLSRSPRRVTVGLPGSEVTGHIEPFVRRAGLVAHGDGVVTRWHTPFDVSDRDGIGMAPSDVERYLAERFGNWDTPTLFFDDHLDAPNTTYDPSLEALFALTRRTRHALGYGVRHYADALAAQLRDVFDIDYTGFMPKPAHPKTLSLPLSTLGLTDRPVVVLAGAFATLDAAALGEIEALASDRHRLVLAVRNADGLGTERLATVKTLKHADAALLYDSVDDLLVDVETLGADELVVGVGAGVHASDITSSSVTVSDLAERIVAPS